MAKYEKPPFNQIPFEFTPGGYQKPDFGKVPFNFGKPTYSQTANLQAAINVMGIYQTSAHTYLKECPIYVLGYSQYGIQILKLPCIYGGIRDVGAYVYGNPEHADLGAYILAVIGKGNLGAYIKSTIQAHKNLGAYIKSTIESSKDLVTYISGFPPKDLLAYIHGWDIRNLLAYIYGIPPKDLQAILNVIEIKDLPADITGELLKSQADLAARAAVFQRECFNLGAYIRSYMMPFDLLATITPFDYRDLQAYSNTFLQASKNLGAYIKRIYTIDLSAYLIGKKGFAIERNLPSCLIGGYGPGDIQAYIYAIPYQSLDAYIKGFRGLKIPFDLIAVIEGYHKKDLSAVISAIHPFDLGAYINSKGKSILLGATIIPKTIHFKRAINIALLEHKDLKGLINFMCFSSEYKGLLAYIKAIYKLDLKGLIFGWIGFNVSDLKCYINTAIYDVEDRVDVRFVPSSSTNEYAMLKLRFGVTDKYTVFDTLQVLYGVYPALDLSASIYGMFRSVDLSASLTPTFDYNYSELPTWINPKTHEAVINLERFETQWQRFVELMFETYGEDNFHYFYVSGANKVYRIDKSRHWTIWAKSYRQDEENMIERMDVRHKYIFKMSNYSSMDEAVRDLIDRVSAYRKINLGAYIDGGLPPHLNLNAYLTPDVKYTWQKHLHTSLIGRLRGYQGTETESLAASITGT